MLQAIIEVTVSCAHQGATGDSATGMPFEANASSHLPKPALMTGTVLPELNQLHYWYGNRMTQPQVRCDVPPLIF